MPNTFYDLPEDDPIFGKTHFVFYAGPMLTAEEFIAKPSSGNTRLRIKVSHFRNQK